jgi:predicted DNA-binding transcriptional regulator YafY
MTNTATRLIRLIMLLQSRPNRKAAELAGELGVSVRTVHRYFEMLDELGIPLYSERGPAGGFSLVRGYKMPPLVLSPEEAVAVGLGATLVEEMWGALYRDAARGALAKLDNLLPDDQRQEIAWARRSLLAAGLQRQGYGSLESTLETLRGALHDNHRVALVYEVPGREEPTCREFDPYTLVYRWGHWYTAGFCHLRSAMRLLRVDRIREVTVLTDHFSIPADYDSRAFLDAGLQPTPAVLARLRFAPAAAAFVRDASIGWSGIEEQPDGFLLATLPAADLQFAASMAISFGPLVTILDPPDLIGLVTDWAEEILKRYSKQENMKGENNG